MSLALIMAHHHSGNSSHFTGPWYIAVLVIVVGIGTTIWRSRRGGGGRDSSAAPVINDLNSEAVVHLSAMNRRAPLSTR